MAILTAPQFLALLGEGMLESDAGLLRHLHDFGPGDFQQPAVHRMGMAFSWTVLSTMTCSSSLRRTALVSTAVSIVALSSSSTAASPMVLGKRPSWVASHGSRGA
jgi:hypothetical protein